jgi:hypothetical protein
VVLAAVGLILVGLGWSTGSRSALISVDLDDRVVESSWAEEGPSFRVLTLDDGRVLTVDRRIVEELGGSKKVVGQHLEKEGGGRDLSADGRVLHLRRSPEAWRMLAMLSLLVLVGLARMWITSQRHPDAIAAGSDETP